MSNWNHSYELGHAHGILHQLSSVASTLESCTNLLIKAGKVGVLKNNERVRVREELKRIAHSATGLLDLAYSDQPNVINLQQMESVAEWEGSA